MCLLGQLIYVSHTRYRTRYPGDRPENPHLGYKVPRTPDRPSSNGTSNKERDAGRVCDSRQWFLRDLLAYRYVFPLHDSRCPDHCRLAFP